MPSDPSVSNISSLPSSNISNPVEEPKSYKKMIIIGIIVVLLLIGLGLGLYFGLRDNKTSEKPIEYRKEIPDSFKKGIEDYFSKDNFPNMSKEDLIKIANFRYKNPKLTKCDENSTNIVGDCDLANLTWACEEANRLWGISIDLCKDDILSKSDEELTKMINDAATDNAQYGEKDYKVSCKSIFPNNKVVANKLIDKNDIRKKIIDRLNASCIDPVTQKPKKDFSKL